MTCQTPSPLSPSPPPPRPPRMAYAMSLRLALCAMLFAGVMANVRLLCFS